MLPDVHTHGCVFIGMLPFPPLQVVQVAAELDGGTLHLGDSDPVFNGRATLVAYSGLYELRLNRAVPWNAPVSMLINAGGIDRAGRGTGAGMPILAVGPLVEIGRAHVL